MSPLFIVAATLNILAIGIGLFGVVVSAVDGRMGPFFGSLVGLLLGSIGLVVLFAFSQGAN